MNKGLLIIGAGGHGKVVKEIAEALGYCSLIGISKGQNGYSSLKSRLLFLNGRPFICT